VDFIFGFGMHNHHDLLTQQPERDLTLFTIVLAAVFKGKRRAHEDLLSIGEIHPVLF
jgi:hypothetical protein